jgi:hypothetical protein
MSFACAEKATPNAKAEVIKSFFMVFSNSNARDNDARQMLTTPKYMPNINFTLNPPFLKKRDQLPCMQNDIQT